MDEIKRLKQEVRVLKASQQAWRDRMKREENFWALPQELPHRKKIRELDNRIRQILK